MEERFFFLLYHVKKKEVQKKDKTFGEKRQSAILKKSKNKEQKGTGSTFTRRVHVTLTDV